MSKTEMVEAIWGSDPRFSDGINYRFVRTEGRAFPARRCLIPASEFRMGTGSHRYRVALDSGNFFYLAAIWDPPCADWPLSSRRSEERRVGKECVRPGRSGWSPFT